MNSNLRQIFFSLLLLVDIATNKVAICDAPIYDVELNSIENRIFQLETSINSQGQIILQMQQQIFDNQREIDILRGQLQESEYKYNKELLRQKDFDLKSSNIKNKKSDINKDKEINNSIISEKDYYNIVTNLARFSKTNVEIDKAIEKLEDFIKKYPKSEYQSDVNFWLGQLNYNKNNKDIAAFYFATVVKKYPKSQKSSESLYKIGLIMQEKGLKEKAKIIFQHILKQYPNSTEAMLAKKKLIIVQK